MSKKKKRRSNSSAAERTRSQGATLADEKDRARKRLNPTARNLMFGDLIFLAVCQLLYSNGLLSDFLSGIATLAGFFMLILALWFQFGKKGINRSGGSGGTGGTGGTGGSGGWPLMK
ncbi:MAG: hypothetical protein AB7E30_08040 [Lawsonibacter sp.]